MTSNTSSEKKNLSEFVSNISTELTSGIIGLTNGLSYNPSELNTNVIAPTRLTFNALGVSNGLQSALDGITDFTAYNPYIHHQNNVTVNVMQNLVVASNRFEIYSRQYRG
jgi:hypothetical protein